MCFQRNVTLLLGRMEDCHCGARRRRGGQRQCMEFTSAATARATCRRGGVKQNSSPRLHARASVVETWWRRPQWAGSIVEAARHAQVRSAGRRTAWWRRSTVERLFFFKRADGSEWIRGSQWGSHVCPFGRCHRSISVRASAVHARVSYSRISSCGDRVPCVIEWRGYREVGCWVWVLPRTSSLRLLGLGLYILKILDSWCIVNFLYRIV
jgi:hypothetical protein